MDMILPYFMGETIKLQECGIDTTSLRKSLDGSLCLVHQHGLTKVQFDEIRPKTSIQTLTYEEVKELLQTVEWKEQEEVK